MAQQGLNNLGVNYEHTLGADDWKNSYDANWVILDTLAQGFVVDSQLTAEPGSPAVGDAYVLANSPTGTNWGSDTNSVENAIAIYTNLPGQADSSPWLYLTPREGWLVYDRTNNVWLQYDSVLTIWASGGHLSRRVISLVDETADYTLGAREANSVVYLSSLFDDTDSIVIPDDATYDYATGTEIILVNDAGGVVTIDTTGLTWVGAAPASIADNASLRIVKITGDTWATV